MKDSGIPWIGEIPSHWDTCFIKQVMRNKSVKGYPDEQVLSLYRDYGVVPKDSRDDNHNVTSEDTSGYKLVDVGDFVINKMKAWQGSMAVSEYRGIISPAYYICRFTAPVYKKYIHYLLRNETYKAEYMRLSTGLRVGQWDLNVDDFLHIPMVLPPIPEQQSIADFLDKKCSEIDELVSLQEKIVEELKAYKQSVITETVCKGLNLEVPMKDSGNKWIGTIPKEWGVARLKNVAEGFSNGTSATQLSGDISDYPVSRIETISTGKINYQKVGYLPYYSGIEKYELTPQDILISHINSLERVGNCAMYLGEQRLFHGMNLLRVRARKDTYPQFLLYYLRSNAFIQQMRECCNHAINQVSVSSSTLKQLSLPLPPYKEQISIAERLDTKCAEIDALISLKQSKIEALKEYKKSIIYEYITGKKEVPYGE